ncbi:MAG: hypothetical protein KKB70_02715, partial [Proteobacteria bacterium]|nr:hypothetical protein [Pseudomonadota bacterium]
HFRFPLAQVGLHGELGLGKQQGVLVIAHISTGPLGWILGMYFSGLESAGRGELGRLVQA